ncbi:putative acetyltransferase [Breoghania corrubedonensis]|uniref:Putative acetyltransferase n=1 Tax=Breoghania corrubedonensis TaxID=665038 RepID=A0A2T5V7N5_9HYPH|nr:GNAT family N-acetyltransferase [Breoghania corrubedonensis]PTW59750.1 putative acetyltransferase [Breoghania corrubedonensis]
MTTNLAIAIEPVNQPKIVELIALSDAYSLARYPAEGHFGTDIEGLSGDDVSFAVVRDGTRAIGCAALKWNGDGTAELKRLFVRDEGRGRGAARKVMAYLEDMAQARGVTRIDLETGPLNTEAVGLYGALGYAECGPFAPYEANPYSLFMTKTLEEGTS